MDARVKPAHDAEGDAASLHKFPDSNFKRPSVFVLAPPREVELLVCLTFCEGKRSAESRIVNKPRLISRIAGRQHHTATPPGAPPRRLKTLVRSSGDLATLGDFAPHACPRPAALAAEPCRDRKSVV